MTLKESKIVYKQLSRATILIAFFSFLSRIVGLLRDRVFASHFGAGDVLDTYYAAFRVPDFLYNLLILGTLSAAFIPVFVEYLHRDEKESWEVANSIFNATLLVMGALAGLLAIFAPLLVSLITPGFGPEKHQQTVQLTRIMMLSPIFFSLSSIFSSILNSFKKFAIVAAVPIIYNLSIIFGVIFLYPAFGITGLAWGVVAGAFLHMALQIPSAIRAGFRWKLAMDLHIPGVMQIFKLFVPRIFGMDLSQISFLISIIIGSLLPAGSITVYAWASNLQAVPLGIFAIAFATVAFPSLSEAVAKGDKEQFKQIFNVNVSQILYTIIPLSSLMLILRAQIVRLILGSGQFDWADTNRTLSTLGFFVISLFAQSLIPLLARAFYSLHNTVIPVLCGLVGMAVNIIGALFLMRFFEPDMRVAALALAFSIASVVQFLILFVWLEIKFGNLLDKFLILKLEKIIVATLLMGSIAHAAKFVVAPYVDTHTFIGLLAQTAICSLLGLAGYLGIGYVLNISESRHILIWSKSLLIKFRNAFSKAPEGV